MQRLVQEELDKVTRHPVARVAVLYNPGGETTALDAFAFVRARGALAETILIFHLDLNAYPDRVGLALLSDAGPLRGAVDEALADMRDKYSAAMELRQVILQLRAAVDGLETTPDIASDIRAKADVVFERDFADVFIPSEELEKLMETVPERQQNLRESWLTASQLWLSASQCIEEDQ